MEPDEHNCDRFDKLATELSLIEDLKDVCSNEVLAMVQKTYVSLSKKLMKQ